jgi:hypothetical protein
MSGSINIGQLEEAGFFVVRSPKDVRAYHGSAQVPKQVYGAKNAPLSTAMVISMAKDMGAHVIYIDESFSELALFKLIKKPIVDVEAIEKAGIEVIDHALATFSYSDKDHICNVVHKDLDFQWECTQDIIELATKFSASCVKLGESKGIMLWKIETRKFEKRQ